MAVAGMNGGLSNSLHSQIDPQHILDHLSNILRATLGATDNDLKAAGSLFSSEKLSETLQRCSRFAQDAQAASICVEKELIESAVNGDANGDTGKELITVDFDASKSSLADLQHFSYRLSSVPTFASNCVSGIIIWKRAQPIDPSTSLFSQLFITNIPGLGQLEAVTSGQGSLPTAYEGFLSAFHNALEVPFDAYIKSQEGGSRRWNKAEDTRTGGIAATKKKLAELGLSLQHLQQNVEVPTSVLHLHPVIQEAIDKASEMGVEPTIDNVSRVGLIPPSLLNDSTILNQLQTSTNQWIQAIQTTTKFDRDPSKGTASQEIGFWLSMEAAIDNIEQQLSSDGVRLTMDVLRKAKRFQATVSFTADTGLREKMETVQNYKTLVRDFPLDELLSAPSLPKLTESINLIFGHMNKKLKLCSYPISRALPLVAAISADLDERIRSLLNGKTLMHLDWSRFQAVMADVDSVFRSWDDNAKEFTNVAREALRKRNEKFIAIKVQSRHGEIQERLSYVKNFRKSHEELQRTIVTVLGPSSIRDAAEADGSTAVIVDELGDVDAVEEVTEAYAALKDIDVLDVSVEGTELWNEAEAQYNEKTARVELSIISRLRDRLATAKTANEMFRVFSKFNALFVRPKIRGAIAEYQTQLIDNVKRDIQALHERFKQQYGHSEAHAMALLRDLPPVATAISWARQIERQLDGYVRKVEDILGPDWHQHIEGQKLETETKMFRKKLDTKPIYDSWYQDVQHKNISISGRLFKIDKLRSASVFELSVNFDGQVITLFKEVHMLRNLGFQVGHAINNVSKDAKRVYPYAVTLMETARIFAQACRDMGDMTEVAMLLNGYLNDALGLITKGVPLRWESFVNVYDVANRDESKHVKFVKDFATAITVLQTKTSTLGIINTAVNSALKDLDSCPYDAEAFRNNIDQIQRAVDQLNLENYSNLQWWVDQMNERIEGVLFNRLQRAIHHWKEAFADSSQAIDINQSHDPRKEQDDSRDLPKLEQLNHEITLRNQAIFLRPPLEHARAKLLEQLQAWLSVVGSLQKVKASRYELRLQTDVLDLDPGFSYLPGRCTDALAEVQAAVESKLSSVSEYVDKWLQFQSLWDLRPEQVYDELQDDLARWLQLIQEILGDRNTFDTSEVSVDFGHIVVHYEQVQLKVNSRYDQWQQDIILKFAVLLGSRMNHVHSEIEQARMNLEGQALEASTQQAVQFITIVQQCKRKVKFWANDIEMFRQGETTLKRQRHQFPKDWLYMDRISDQWDRLLDVLDRKSRIVDDQSDALRAKIEAEEKVVLQNIADIREQWSNEKPVSGSIPPDEAEVTLMTFEKKMTRLRDDAEGVARAKEALDLPATSDNVLPSLLEEVQDFRSVWANLKTVWDNLNDLRDQNWVSVQPRKVRTRLDELVRMMRDMPARMRQYAAFEHMQNRLRRLQKVNTTLSELRSEAIEDRHWEKIFKNLNPSKRYSRNMLLGDVWDLNLDAGEAFIKDVLTQAQGEMSLKKYLEEVGDTWQNYELDLVNYQNKCRLIRGWDDLFAKCSEHLNNLQAMRHSPYYRQFQSDASAWEERLNRVHILFDVWIDVQRQWVYLEGVFNGNADIQHILKTESAHFRGINARFFDVMRAVSRSPLVMDVLNIPDIQNQLEELAQRLNKIQKALGEYLERERVAFPRFYFVGDEDLLEIIGNSNDSQRVSKHLRKMFAGMANLVTDEESGDVVGFASKEGERLYLQKEISLSKTPKVNEWLAALEYGMKTTLAALLLDAVRQYGEIIKADSPDAEAFNAYISDFPAQVVVLATQVCWTDAVEAALTEGSAVLHALYDKLVALLQLLASTVLLDLDNIFRKKCEQLITEFVHQRDVVGKLLKHNANSPTHYQWLLQMRYVYRPEADTLDRLHVKMANAGIVYGYEYLGVQDRLVRTPLTDRCFLTLTQALCQRLGGSPYGPAGTGKTESVKALGLQLGRFTLVFCCDDTFDFQAMGRIFLGICKVGAWGCFDEFNRLEERILSAVSQQIQNIQLGLREAVHNDKAEIELVGRNLRVNANTGIFVTMNPGYAGRSNLPDNLKKLFRSVAMSKPDKELIAEVMLYSQGFACAKQLSRQTVPFFDKCSARLSSQAHYDFGLRALKSVLVSSGGLKRARLATQGSETADFEIVEPQIVVQSIRETIAPKLIRNDVEIMLQIEQEAFPGVAYIPAAMDKLEQAIREEAKEAKLLATEAWMTKVLQLYQIQNLHHGLMMVGSSGSGKSSAWRVLLKALQRVDNIEGVCHVIDPKVMSKESLYGTLDSTTREWTDGLFTSILRKIVDNLRGEDSKRHWIIFDGDVDPIWVENLNSVLDDNKMLTLPNGERLNLPPNVRIMFEVETLRYATLATVSRCGMVWFSDDTVSTEMIVSNYLSGLRTVPIDVEGTLSPAETIATQTQAADLLQRRLTEGGFILQALEQARNFHHIMEFTNIRVLNTLFSLLNQACRSVLEYNVQHSDFPLDATQIEGYLSKKLLLSLVWSLTGDCPLVERKTFGDTLAAMSDLDLPTITDLTSLIDFDVTLPQSAWTPWQSQVSSIEIDTNQVTDTDIVIPTLDTVRHEDILYSWLADHKPLILCGPPGSGKTMTLFNALKKLEHMEIVGLNFSSATTPDLLIKTFEQYCEYRKTLNGVVLQPSQVGRWLVVFCDEINLPAPDKYGTPRAISFLRQLVEQNGFWRTTDKQWVTLDRIQFVGACNPPTDPGRTPLGLRFLRHAPVVMVDYPGELSLQQIYGTFNNAVLKVLPNLRGYAEPLTKAMVQVYSQSQNRFTPEIQPHYVYSPRELTRWVRGIYETIKPYDNLDIEGLVRVWAHEALRLFQDRLISEEERKWTDDAVRRIAMEHFPTINEDRALAGPILFSSWLSKRYESVDREALREMVTERLRTFSEEEVDVRLVPFNDLLEHVLRIDRVFRQSQGHLILIGVSGSGKTTLSRFVAWMNGLKVYQIKVHGRYSAEDFDDDLRNVLKRCGCRGEKICFIMDESNVLDSAFLERMNTLLANAEVPGLFEGDQYAALMNECREGAQREGGKVLDSPEEMYKWFKGQIAKNLHVVFTMNPPTEGLSSKAATSPALFNRCVLNWFGDWSDQALFQVGSELTQSMDLDRANYVAPNTFEVAYRELQLPPTHRDALVNAMVHIHYSLHRFNERLHKQQDKVTYLTPRHFLDFVDQFTKLHREKRDDLEEQQRHLNVGLAKLNDTFDKVRSLKSSLAEKGVQLDTKQKEANERMKRMVASKSEAEKNQEQAQKIQVYLTEKEQNIAERQEQVQRELDEVEPMVLEAKKSVSNIKTQQLDEVRSMQRPPNGVRLAMEAVCSLLGHRAIDWKSIQQIMRRSDFIGSIVRFDTEKQMTDTLRRKMDAEYLRNPDFSYEKVNRASKACGPLVQWVEAQVKFSQMLDEVEPRKEAIRQLEEDALQTRAEAEAISNKIADLEQSIGQYEAEYRILVTEIEAIKSETKQVRSKVERSERLLGSLSSERARWDEGSKSFDTQIDTLVGDVLIAAALVTYGGFYDQQYRKAMADDWFHHLSMSGIRFKEHNPVTDYLSTADERLKWQDHTLPVDDLCTENAIMLKRFNRYPLIIDPSGRVTEFLQNEYKDRKLTITSFLDPSFTKQLESSLRFGNPILIQDAEHIDPILTHVLNKEHQKTGGRVLIQLGKQEIDFSPAFKLFLSSRDPSAHFAPDVCSRTTLINFTVTQSSLQTQSLNDVLKSERPDVDERRSNIIKMQGEFSVHLRRLEKQLLQALNDSQGNILDDDNVLKTLETLKREAAEITAKAAETEGVWSEVETITQQYKVIARSCSAIFAVLDHLSRLNHFYQFSLQYFLGIFGDVLNAVKQSRESNGNARIDAIVRNLFISTYQRTSLAMLQQDRVALAMLLAQAAPYKMNRSLIDTCLDDDVQGVDVSSQPNRKDEVMARALKMRIFKDILPKVSSMSWRAFLSEELAENHVPQPWPSGTETLDKHLLSIILIKLFRVDRFVPAVERFVNAVFGSNVLDFTSDLGDVVRQVSAFTPVALCSTPGFDASYRVEHLVDRAHVKCEKIAMGSNEGVASADKAISAAAATGSWVLIKNVHLAPGWLQSLEKRVEALKPHEDFRLFLSMETSPKIPVNLLRASRILMNEQPAGIRANMKDSLSALSERATKQPVERARIYLLLAMLHAVVQERLRYAPSLGWKGFWEFNDSDVSLILDVTKIDGANSKNSTNAAALSSTPGSSQWPKTAPTSHPRTSHGTFCACSSRRCTAARSTTKATSRRSTGW